MFCGIQHSPSTNVSTGLSILAQNSSCKVNIVFLQLISISFPQLDMRLGLFSYYYKKSQCSSGYPQGSLRCLF